MLVPNAFCQLLDHLGALFLACVVRQRFGFPLLLTAVVVGPALGKNGGRQWRAQCLGGPARGFADVGPYADGGEEGAYANGQVLGIVIGRTTPGRLVRSGWGTDSRWALRTPGATSARCLSPDRGSGLRVPLRSMPL